MDRQPLTPRRFLARLARNAVYSALIIFGGGAVLRSTPGPVPVAIAAMLAYVAVIGIAMYLTEKRWASRR